MKLIDKNLAKLVKGQKILFVLGVSSGIISVFFLVFQAKIISNIVSRSFLENTPRDILLPSLTLLLFMFLSRAVFSFLSDFFSRILAVKVKEELRKNVFQKILKLNPVSLRNKQSGEILTLFLSGIEDIDKYFSEYLPQIIYAFVTPVIFLGFILPVDLVSGIILLVTAPLIPLFMVLIGFRAEKITRDQWDQFSRLGGYYLDTLRGLITLKTLSQGKTYSKKLEEVNENYRQATINVLRVTFLSALVLEIIATISTAVVAVEIGLRLLYGSFTFNTAFFILLLVPEYFLPLRQLSLKFHASNRGLAASIRIFEFLGIEEWNKNPVLVSSGSSSSPSQQINRFKSPFVIKFNEVHYKYPDRDDPAVTDLTFQIGKGQHVAIVGDSGSGKSTLVNLILKFLIPTRGLITINNLPLDDIPVDEWLSQIAYVPQSPYVWSGTIAQNVNPFDNGRDEAGIRNAIELAQLGDWISSLPGGIYTQVGEDGYKLSSGQAQRLAIARAFFRNSPLLILDEPTSAIDPETESILQVTQEQLCAGKTVLTIAHRLPTVYKADWILVMKRGRLIEQGTHQNLYKQAGDYYRFVNSYGAKG